MKATDILTEEHRVIKKVLLCLERIVGEAEQSGKLNEEAARAAVDFFRNFADGCHHAKEEDRLFVVMEQQGVPREGGPIGVMLSEHDQGRHYVQGMEAAIKRAAQGDKLAIDEFASNARHFTDLLNLHIQKEDQVLFPMADSVLAPEVGDTLLTDFKRIEEEAGGDRHARYLQLARNLCTQYAVPFLDDAEIATIRKELQTG